MTTKTKAMDWSKPLIQRCGRAAKNPRRRTASVSPEAYPWLVDCEHANGSFTCHTFTEDGCFSSLTQEYDIDLFNTPEPEPAPVPIEWRTVRFWVAVSDSGRAATVWDEERLPDYVRDKWKRHGWAPLKIVRTYQAEVTK